VSIPYTPLLENRSLCELDAAMRFSFYIAARTSFFNKLFEWLFSSARLPPWRPRFDFWPGHVSPGTSSLGWRLPWSSLFMVMTRRDLSCVTLNTLQVPDVLEAGRCFADALQVLFGLHPSAVHGAHARGVGGGGGGHVESILYLLHAHM
jgi:hypothetical protein